MDDLDTIIATMVAYLCDISGCEKIGLNRDRLKDYTGEKVIMVWEGDTLMLSLEQPEEVGESDS